MLAEVGTVAVIVLVVLVATLLPMYAKWRAMQALVDRLARHSRPEAADDDKHDRARGSRHDRD